MNKCIITIKSLIKDILHRIGFRLFKSRYYKLEYVPENYHSLNPHDEIVIFDVGGNIGQSVRGYRRNFPNSVIYTFEPFTILRHELTKNTAHLNRVIITQCAMGEVPGTLQVTPPIDTTRQDATIHCKPIQDAPVETITVDTVDNFCEKNGVSHIHILKSDTEGYDYEVLLGAKNMLTNHCVDYILFEFSLNPNDQQHTYLFQVRDYLTPLGYELVSFYSLVHRPNNGELFFGNALFRLQSHT